MKSGFLWRRCLDKPEVGGSASFFLRTAVVRSGTRVSAARLFAVGSFWALGVSFGVLWWSRAWCPWRSLRAGLLCDVFFPLGLYPCGVV